ncbi:hypothetical protein Tcan_16808 [Toxocara canis]|uniref:Secreted protein n=1 Tax=Toxocara canis TaxID=6265 RepID=A0A0B2VRT2_TOXCA|nr:hypothetical protein Tcan_16808 [Toxocara canis]
MCVFAVILFCAAASDVTSLRSFRTYRPPNTSWHESASLIHTVNYKNFCVIYNFWEGVNSVDSESRITLVLHSTPSFFKYIEIQVLLLNDTC